MTPSQKIYKYPVEITDGQIIHVPAGARVISVVGQNYGIVLYAIVPIPNDFPKISKELVIKVVGTGHEINFNTVNEYEFLGTVLLHGGSLVFHVFCKDRGYMG